MKYKLFILALVFSYSSTTTKSFLVFGGKTGWIGQQVVLWINSSGHRAICAKARLENRQDIIAEIKKYKPDRIINAAGITGRPNVNWCESHKQETIRGNVLGTLNLIDIAYQFNTHVTHLNTGCIYAYNQKHPMNSGIGFTEQDEPNFQGSFYSRTKIYIEKLILEYPNVLNLRIRMPIASDLSPRGFIGKIIQYAKVINIPNSMTILDDLLPKAVDMASQGITGNYNCVNPGTISHHEILELYKRYINPNHTYKPFTLEEQNKMLKIERSNCELDTQKLLQLYPDIPNIKTSIHNVFKRIKSSSKISMQGTK